MSIFKNAYSKDTHRWIPDQIRPVEVDMRTAMELVDRIEAETKP